MAVIRLQKSCQEIEAEKSAVSNLTQRLYEVITSETVSLQIAERALDRAKVLVRTHAVVKP